MENFAAITIILLIGMAIPVLALVGTIVFDAAVVSYALIQRLRGRGRRHLAADERAQADRTAGSAKTTAHSTRGTRDIPIRYVRAG